MALNWNEIRTRAASFSREWKDETSETGEYQSFWNEFFEVFGVRRRSVARYQQKVELIGERHRGFIDLFWPGTLIVEHKSTGQNLDSAYSQAGSYFDALDESNKPRYIIVTDYARIRFYDLEAAEGIFQIEFDLGEFAKNIRLFGFIAGFRTREYRKESPINIKAVRAVGDLYEAILDKKYPQEAIDKLLTRLVFCFFADDTGIFNHDTFRNYFEERTYEDGSDVGSQLNYIFQILNTSFENRPADLPDELSSLEYVNGGLFEGDLPMLHGSPDIRKAIIKAMEFDWSAVSPAIFGSMFQSVMDDEERRSTGSHYTSETNILKVIESLFLDDLRKELADAGRNEGRLRILWEKISHISLLDPACGCGNFLVVAYRELRRIELEILKRLYKDAVAKVDAGQTLLPMSIDISTLSKVSIENMYGIELNSFPAQIAQLSLWLSDHLSNVELGDYFGKPFRKLPLKEKPHIVQGNALRMDWEEVVPRNKLACIFGNPPFNGAANKTPEQVEDMKVVFDGEGGKLDYVAGWYKKAVEYVGDTPIRTAFVSTNSITQGEQVALLWPLLWEQGFTINFAHQTFKWTNEAPGKAAVYVIIVGFSRMRSQPCLYSYATVTADPTSKLVSNINGYLVDGPDAVIDKRRTPLCDMPVMVRGSIPYDDGHLLMSEKEKERLIDATPKISKYIRRYGGAREMLSNKWRYCLWLLDVAPSNFHEFPEIIRRVQAVKAFREAGETEAVRRAADKPSLFGDIRQPSADYLMFPRVSSEKREYMPIGYVDAQTILGDSAYGVPGATIFMFGILQSEMHMTWMRAVAGRLKSDYRYSNTLVYNNFPWPQNPTEVQKKAVEDAANEVLAARKKFPNSSLAELYGPDVVEPHLLKAHKELDRSVDACYGKRGFKSEPERLEFLFDLYSKFTAEEEKSQKKRKIKSKRAAW